MREEMIDGVAYRIGRLPAKAQFNVVRRLGPVLASAGPALKMWAVNATRDADGPESGLDQTVDDLFTAFGPLATALGELSDESSDYVLGRCLSVCQIQRNGAAWANVATAHGDLMFGDMTLAVMLKLTMFVLQENLTDFFSALTGSSAAAP